MNPQQTETPKMLSFLSVVIPVFNEIETLNELFQRLQAVFNTWERPHEIIFIDDGSSDGSSEKIKSFCQVDSCVKLICFSRNFGQHKAVAAGFDHAKGPYIVALDADLQVYPEDIPKLVEKLDEGFEIVAGYREARREKQVFRKISSYLVNFIFRYIFRLPYRDIGCGMQAFRKHILEGLDPFSVLYSHRVIYSAWRSGRFTDVSIRHDPRHAGRSKYSFSKLVFLFLDIFVTFFTQPIQLFVFLCIGGFFIFTGIIELIILSVATFMNHSVSSWLWLAGVVLPLNGLLFISFGLINERINRINHRLNRTPPYDIREIIHVSHNNYGEKKIFNEKNKENQASAPHKSSQDSLEQIRG